MYIYRTSKVQVYFPVVHNKYVSLGWASFKTEEVESFVLDGSKLHCKCSSPLLPAHGADTADQSYEENICYVRTY